MGCGSSNSRNTTTAGERVPDEPLQTSKLNNNVSTIPVKNVSEEQGSGASRETTEADQRAADVEKEMYVVETKTASKSQDLTIVHFNDVYNIEPREKEPVGGAARFATKLASFRHLNPLTVFSGDCLNPSSSEYTSLQINDVNLPVYKLKLTLSLTTAVLVYLQN